MKKDFNTGLRKGIEADRVKLTRRRKLLLREMGLAEDLDSTELAEKLHAQTLVVDVLNRNLVRRDEEIEKLKARIAELEGGAKPVAKTSANSSVPPSRNPIGVPHTQSQRKPSGRKTGGQRGHQGGTRLQSGDVTGTERWYPAAVCPVCGKPPDMESATIAATRQVVDIPLPIMATVTGHLQMRVKCSCGHCCKGRFPENVNAPVSFGPNIMALASYLSTYQNVPFKRLTHLFETGFGLHVSEGTVSNMLNTMKRISKKPYEMIRRKVAAGKVAGADETGVNVSGKNSWLWAFQNKAATYLAFDKSRSHDVVNRNFSPEERRGTVRVTDRWPAYFMGEVGAGTRKNMEARLDELLARPPVYAKEDGDGTELDKLKKGIAKHRDHIFTFLTNPAVPPTNNDSEKALRPAKTKLKVSGCFRTESGAENYATVASVIQTAVKNGQNPFEVLRVIAALALA